MGGECYCNKVKQYSIFYDYLNNHIYYNIFFFSSRLQQEIKSPELRL